MFLICPAFSVPKYDKKYKSKSDLIMFILFLIFIIYSIFQLIISGINNGYDKKSKFRAIKMPVTYTEKFIKYSGLTRERIHVLEKTKAEAPFYYTSEGFNFDKYEDAEEFCKSLNAKVANHKEIYNIIFNKFDTFGNQYYWTSEKAGVNNLLLRFKNMTYEIVINPGNTKPAVYCTIPASEDFVLQNNRFFTRILPETTKNKMNKINIKELLAKSQEEKDKLIQQQNLEDKQSVEDEQFVEDKQSVKNEQSLNNENSLRTTEEAVYINFSIKHVTKEVFDALLSKGYLYNPEHKANSYYEINNSNLNSLKGLYLNNSDNNVRYCYYPFAEYQNLNLNNEKEIWKQNFCIPSFTLIQRQPVLKKNRYEKDVYCYANGGRVPNIAELAAVIKVLNINPTGQSFWTNIKITDISSMEQLPVSIYYTKDGFITVQAEASNQEINTFCITQSEEHSNIIANYASKFWNEDGKNYAQIGEFFPKPVRIALDFESDRLHRSPHEGLLGRAAQQAGRLAGSGDRRRTGASGRFD